MNAKEESIPFANFFSDDTATDLSKYYPSMHDHLQGLAVADTLLPRRKLKRLLILSMLMTLGMALLSVYSTHILSRLGLVALWQHYDDVTNNLLVQISTQLLAAGLIDNSTVIPFPRPPQSCKLNTPLCNISLPWLYGSVISLSCAFGVLQTLSKPLSPVRNWYGLRVSPQFSLFIGPWVSSTVPNDSQASPRGLTPPVGTDPPPVGHHTVDGATSSSSTARSDAQPPRIVDARRTEPRTARARASVPLVETRTVAPVLATFSQQDAPLPILVAIAGCAHTHPQRGHYVRAGRDPRPSRSRDGTTGRGSGKLLDTRTAGDRASSPSLRRARNIIPGRTRNDLTLRQLTTCLFVVFSSRRNKKKGPERTVCAVGVLAAI
ncbi:hypothetical protein EDB87DRAFT_1682907 [Lactarius vividus]|nr:hypothetical protein EDB87DRAFT_1682907 [Lactarius vividus]